MKKFSLIMLLIAPALLAMPTPAQDAATRKPALSVLNRVILHYQEPVSTAQKSAQDNNLKTAQELLSALEYQTRRATSAEQQRDAWRQQAADWQALYQSEKSRSEALLAATQSRTSAQSDQSQALTLLREQYQLAQAELEKARNKIRSLEKSRFRWGMIGAALGFGLAIAR